MTTSSASTLQNGQFTCSMTDPFLVFMKGEVRKIEKNTSMHMSMPSPYHPNVSKYISFIDTLYGSMSSFSSAV